MEQTQVRHVPLKEAVTAVRVQHRDRIHAVARWSMSEGHPVPMEHVALIIAAKCTLAGGETELDRWNGDDVATIPSVMQWWCAERNTTAPDGLAESLSTYLRFVALQRQPEPSPVPSHPAAGKRRSASRRPRPA